MTVGWWMETSAPSPPGVGVGGWGGNSECVLHSLPRSQWIQSPLPAVDAAP